MSAVHDETGAEMVVNFKGNLNDFAFESKKAKEYDTFSQGNQQIYGNYCLFFH